MNSKEQGRLKALHSYDILYAVGLKYFDELAELAAHNCNTPIAQINFIDEYNQWSLASCGMEGNTISREQSFCSKTIQEDDSLVIEDARQDPRFENNVLVTGEVNIQFYAGVNIKSQNGYNIGTICVIDHEPKRLTEQQFEDLHKFARQVEYQLAFRYKQKQLDRKILYLNSTVDLQLQVDPYSYHIDEFVIDGKINEAENLYLQDLLVNPSDMSPINDWLQSTGPDGFPLWMETKLNVIKGSANWYAITGTYKYGKLYLTAKNINRRIAYERQLKQTIEDKNALLSEVHHRVKNNLAIVSGLLELEAENHEDDRIQQVLAKCQLRIHSIAEIHESLYSTLQFSSLPIHDYLYDLLNAIAKSFDPDDYIDIELECDPVTLNINQSIPMALMLNELVINAFEHAFVKGQEGNIWIQIKEEEGILSLDVSDNGRGLPSNFNLNMSSSLGITLIQKLVQQVDGTIEIEDPLQSHFRIEFPIRDQKGAHSYQEW